MTESNESELFEPGTGSPTIPDLVVAIGASGGSIQSLEAILPKLGSSSRLAVVVVLQHREALDEKRLQALAGEAGLSVGPISAGDAIEAGRVYLPQPNVIVTVENGCFATRVAEEPAGERGTIDSFFVSLASDQQERAVGVVLGGVGGDGALGVTAIREAGGLTIAEQVDPRLELPTSNHGAVDLADFVLEPHQIVQRIESFSHHLSRIALDKEMTEHKAELAASLDRVASILLNKTGHDFHGYKKNTFLRRVQRRMQVIGAESLDDYTQALQADRDEPQHLFNDLLIGVTQFFRDSHEFALLEQEVIPRLLEGKGRDDQVRLWVLGCATGEEAYSLAILLRESMARLEVVPHVQIFATDIDGRALTSARVGRFSREIERDVSEERLARWFVKEGDTYCVVKELREMCIFSQHNVIKDAPFSRINLISCRNLLIYLEPELQNRVIPLFHFALQPGGYLFLGNSENVSRHQKLFVPIDRRYRIFRRLDTATRVLPDFPITASPRHPAAPSPFVRPRQHDGGLAARALRIAERHAPAYVITDEQHDILHFSGGTGRYLDPSSGVASLNLINLVHRDLRLDLRAALTKALEQNEPIRVDRLRMGREGKQRRVDLIIEPLQDRPNGSRHLVVLFKDGEEVVEGGTVLDASATAHLRDEHVQRLESELRINRERLQATIEELESTNEELKSSNEEYQSLNEELQSANEELETSKEELQSINEELTTVNGELAHRVQELGRANSDMKNLLENTQIATVFLDNNLKVMNYTPAIAEIFHFVESDLGRPITHIKSRVIYDEIHDDLRTVLRSLRSVEREVMDPETRQRYIARVLPYRSIDNFIAGAVITFLDITPIVRAEEALRDSEERFRSIVTQAAVGIARADVQGMFTYVNDRYCEIVGRERETLVDRLRLQDLVHPEDMDRDLPLLEKLFSEERPVAIETRCRRPDGAIVWVRSNANPLYDGSGKLVGATAIVVEVTAEHEAVEQVKASSERNAVLVAELQHRTRNLLGLVRSMARRILMTSPSADEFHARLDERLGALSRVQGLLSRAESAAVDLRDLIRLELSAVGAEGEGRRVGLEGPPVGLPFLTVQTMSLAIHELATNARKHGALAAPEGRLLVTWRLEQANGAAPTLVLEWCEEGIVQLEGDITNHSGYGRELIERALPYQLGAATQLELDGGRLRCRIALPLHHPSEIDHDERNAP